MSRTTSRIRRLFTWSALASLVVLGLLWVFRARTLGPLAIRLAEGWAERELDVELSVERLGGSWLGSLEVDGLRAQRRGASGPLVRARAQRIEARYSLLALLRGDDDWLEEVVVRAEDLELDLADFPASEGPPPRPPARLPRVDVALASLRLALPGRRTLAADELSVRGGDGSGLVARAGLTWSDPARTLSEPLAARARWEERTLVVEEASVGELLQLERGTVGLASAPASVELEGTLLGGALHVRSSPAGAGTGDGAESWRVAVEGLELGRVPALLEGPSPDAPPLTLAGTLDARAEASEERLSAHLEVRDLDLGELFLEHLEGELVATPETLSVPRLRASAGKNTLVGEGWSLPLGVGRDALLRGASGSLSVDLRDLPALVRGVPEGVPAHEVALAGGFSEGTLRLSEGRVTTAGGGMEVRRGSLALPAEGAPLSEARLALEFRVDFTEVGELARLLGREDVHGALSGALSVDGTLARPRGRLEGTMAGLEVASHAVGDGELALTLRRGLLEVERCSLRGELGTLEASGGYDTRAGRFERLSLDARARELGALGVPRLSGGTAHAVVALDGPLRTPSGTLVLEADGLSLGSSPVEHLRLVASSDGERATLEELEVAAEDGRLHLAGELRELAPADSWTFVLAELEAERGAGRLELDGPATFSWHDPGRWSTTPIRLRGSGRASLAASRDGDATELTLDCEELDPLPLLQLGPLRDWRTSGIDAHVDLHRDGEGLQASFDVELPALRASSEDAPWTALARGSLDGGRLRLERLAVEHARVGTLSAQGSFPFAPLSATPLPSGPLDLVVVLDAELDALGRRVPRMPAALDGLRGGVRLDARVTGSWEAVRGELRLDARDLVTALLGPELGEEPAHLLLSVVAGDACRLEALSLTAPSLGTVGATGSIEHPLDLRSLWQRDLASWREAPASLDLELALDGLGWLARRSDAVRRAEGNVEGRLSVKGPLGDPEVDGSVAVHDAALRLAADFPTLDSIEARLDFRGRRVELQGLEGALGGAPVSLEGSVDLADADPVLHLVMRGENLLLARRSGVRLRADADLAVEGPLSSLSTTGTLAIREGRYARDMDFLRAIRGEAAPPSTGGRGFTLRFWREPPLSNMRFDVAIRSASPFVIANNVASGEVRPELSLKGTGEVPILVGKVFVDPSQISLPSGTLRIESGLVAFREEAPFSPRLELSGRTRLRGYEVGVRVSGDLLAPEMELWSTPPLPQEDLLVLFLTGELPEGTVKQRGTRAASTVAVYLAKDYVSRWFRGESDEESFLERIEIEVGADVTQSGAPTTEVTYYVSDRPRDTGWVPYLAAERDEYDKINLGFGFLIRLR